MSILNSPADLLNSNRTFLTGGSGAIGPGKLLRRTPLTAGLICLALLAFFCVILFRRAQPEMSAYWIMAAAFLAVFFYSTPPVRLEASGYGELIVSVLVAFLVPAFAFNLQTGQIHRLLAMTGFPLAALHMAMLLAFDLSDYAADLKTEKNTLLVRLGWQAGINLHNILILSAYLIILAASFFGYPRFAVIAGFLSLPIGLYQIWQMRLITQGAKPYWSRLTMTALTLFAITAYLLAYSFWVN